MRSRLERYPSSVSLFFISVILLITSYSYLLLSSPSYTIVYITLVLSLLILVRPEWSYFYALVFMFITSFYFELYSNLKMKFDFTDLFAITALCSWFLRTMTQVNKPHSYSGLDLLLALFFLWATFSLIWVNEKGQGFIEIYKLIASFSMYYLTKTLIKSSIALREMIVVLTIIGVFEALLSLVSIWMQQGYRIDFSILSYLDFNVRFWALKTISSEGGRGSGTAAAHTIAVLLNMVIFLSIGYYFIANTIRQKWIWSVSIVIMTAGMISTLTKSSIVSFLLGIMFIIAHTRKLRSKLVTSFILLLLCFITIAGISRIKDIERSINFSQHQMESGDSATSMGTRLDWWGEGFDKLSDTAGLGYGIGGFRAAIDNIFPDGSHHAVLFDLGLFGFSVYICIFSYCFIIFYRHLNQCCNEGCRKLMLSYLAGYLVMILSWTVSLYYTYSYMWFYLGLGFVIMNLYHSGENGICSEKRSKDSFVAMITDHVK